VIVAHLIGHYGLVLEVLDDILLIGSGLMVVLGQVLAVLLRTVRHPLHVQLVGSLHPELTSSVLALFGRDLGLVDAAVVHLLLLRTVLLVAHLVLARDRRVH